MIRGKAKTGKVNDEKGHEKAAGSVAHVEKNIKRDEKQIDSGEAGKAETKKTLKNNTLDEKKGISRKAQKMKKKSMEAVVDKTKSKETLEDKKKAVDGKTGRKTEDKQNDKGEKKKKTHLLKDGQILLDKFRVEGLLADGGFAQVFSAIHEDTKTRWAVKIESEKCDRKRMKLEILVLMLLRGKSSDISSHSCSICPNSCLPLVFSIARRHMQFVPNNPRFIS
ncbi:hypothetical protein DICVIV_14126 [Dictyocaulus viviparus]|uniref:Protein kinase domain-containing protein n=1 Tax=Dictyocaulus viviparus TaxID=29172 RepID=A0A0D8X8J7_DICVI|nr:hypothetical protein DICVIV_14126 [Dictyocaulus viviparus]